MMALDDVSTKTTAIPIAKPLIAEFVDGLSKQTQQLQDACRADDLKTIRKVCKQLKGSGGTYGFELITEMASRAMAALVEEEPDVEAIKQAVKELIALARRAVAD